MVKLWDCLGDAFEPAGATGVKTGLVDAHGPKATRRVGPLGIAARGGFTDVTGEVNSDDRPASA